MSFPSPASGCDEVEGAAMERSKELSTERHDPGSSKRATTIAKYFTSSYQISVDLCERIHGPSSSPAG